MFFRPPYIKVNEEICYITVLGRKIINNMHCDENFKVTAEDLDPTIRKTPTTSCCLRIVRSPFTSKKDLTAQNLGYD